MNKYEKEYSEEKFWKKIANFCIAVNAELILTTASRFIFDHPSRFIFDQSVRHFRFPEVVPV